MPLLALDDPRWGGYVAEAADALPFHLPAWAALLAECYHYPAFVVASEDATGRIVGGVPVVDVSGLLTGRRWVSLPFTDYCPVLADEASTASVLAEVRDATRRRGITSFEQRAPLPGQPGVHTRTAAVRHTLALGGSADALYRGFTKMHQRNIQKADKSSLRITLGAAPEDVARFYRLHVLTRRRLGVPVQPRRFFSLLADRLIGSGLGMVATAYVGAAPAAAALFIGWNGTLIYKFGASDHQFWSHRPNNLLFWTVIRWAVDNGYHTLDWGRTDLEDQGLRDFKRGWGAVEHPLEYAVLAARAPNPSSGRVRRALGSVIRRSSPWVTRAIGEALYRYAV